MDASSEDGRFGRGTIGQRAIVLLAAIVAYGANFWPLPQLQGLLFDWLDHPAYEGFKGAFLPHFLIYTAPLALWCGLLWFGLAVAGLIDPPRLRNVRRALVAGTIGGVVSLVGLFLFAWLAMPAGSVHWIPPQPWKIAGNVFSNFYEEFIYRGFLLAAFTRVTGFWPAAVISSVMWGALHTQYPLSLQLLVVAFGIYWSWLAMRSRSLWAPYTTHMISDLIADCLIG
jgi:membrane protease YdiL (CAAX protease family)